MSKEKKGGARLEGAQKQTTPRQENGPAPGKKPRKPMRKGTKIFLIILSVFLLLIAAVLVWYKLVFAVLPNPNRSELPDRRHPTPSGGVVDGSSQAPVSDEDWKEDVYTFLVVGRDVSSGNTDTIMMVTYDLGNQKATVLNIPRDTMVDARHPGKNRKINAVYNLGKYYAEEGDERTGIDYLKEAVTDMFGYAPDFYVFINWEAFGRLVDAIGGVDFEVPFTMKYKDPTQNLVINQPAGWRHLSGQDAMEVVRWRHDNTYSTQYRDGDLGRIRTQQALLKAIVGECLQLSNVTKIGEFAEIFAEEVETDLTLGNLVAFAERAILGGLSTDDVEFVTMPLDGVYVNGASYVQAKPEELLALVNEKLNPYTEDLTIEDMDIIQYSDSKGYYRYTGK